VSDVADRDDGIEFIPTDDIVEAEAASAEEEAVHVEDADQPKERMSVEAEDFEAETLNEAEAEEAGAREDHEEDLEEVVRRHYGIVEEQPDDELARDEREGVRDLGPGEFICRSCFMRRSASQQAEPGNGVCTDCAADGPT
jgi:hypothetical protein